VHDVVEWASWAGLAFVPPGANPPRPVVAFVPAKELTIEDTWRTVGLRGTASNEVVLERAFVPRHRIFELAKFAHDSVPQGEVVEPGTVFKLPFMGMAAIHLAYTRASRSARSRSSPIGRRSGFVPTSTPPPRRPRTRS
jgi:alkylation response protein AidB-like acyl-CoA dehydrogenase